MIKFEQVKDLTDKELLIIKRFSEGELREAVSQELGIESRTLRCYLSRIYTKLGVKKLHQAVVWYLTIYSK